MDSAAVTIILDDRELKSTTARRLYELGCKLDSKRLQVGDYVLSDRCCAERKNAEDLEASIMDGRLFSQAVELCENYSAPILAVVGTGFSHLNPKAVRGSLSSLAVDFRIPTFWFDSEGELADFLYALAYREQVSKGRVPRLQTAKKEVALSEQQRLVVESLPSVGPVSAKALLDRFGSVKAVFGAQSEELVSVEGIGPIRAERIRKLIEEKYLP